MRAFERRVAKLEHSAIATHLFERWGELPAGEVSRMLRELLVVDVSRRTEDRPAAAVVRGVWETTLT